jgi:iron-sulfur cluster assembly protein
VNPNRKERAIVLSLTDNAVEAARQLAADSGLEPDPGLRISAGEPTPTGTPIEITLASGPESSDQTVENAGATVYVGDDVAGFLDDKVLDAAIEGDRVRFRIGPAA